MASHIERRKFLATLGGAAAAWPLAARAQQGERMRRIGVLLSTHEGDPSRRAQLTAFVQRLTELGWADGRNARLDVRWTAGSVDAARKYAAELVALASDVIVTDTSFDVAAVQQATRTVPIVFGGVIDPVGAGLVDSLARPGGNTTGFTAFEYAIGAKWLELLKEVAPGVTRAAVLRDPTIAAGVGQFAAIQATAPFGIELTAVGLHDAGAIEPAVAAFARGANGGLVMTASPFGGNHPDVITTLAARYKLPAVYPWRYFVNARRPDVVRVRPREPVPLGGPIRRPYPQGREAGRPTGAGANQVRASDQPQGRQGDWTRGAGDRACPR